MPSLYSIKPDTNMHIFWVVLFVQLNLKLIIVQMFCLREWLDYSWSGSLWKSVLFYLAFYYASLKNTENVKEFL